LIFNVNHILSKIVNNFFILNLKISIFITYFMKTMKKMNARKGLTAMGFMPLFVGVILWIGVLTPARTQVITIGGPTYEAASSIIQTKDGGYAIAGSTNSFGAGKNDVYVVKLDGSGNIQWTRTIGGGRI
jgi:hypothetical protein